MSKSELGDAWPLTVESGTVTCENGSQVIFAAPNGTRYAVNGTAMSQTDLPRIDEIWAPDPTIDGAKVNISPIIDAGLALC